MQGLPYGTYLVVETTVPHDLFQAEPFIVTVDPEQDNNPWGAMATPKDSVMTGSDSYQKFTVLDEEIEVYLRITKLTRKPANRYCCPTPLSKSTGWTSRGITVMTATATRSSSQ